MAKGRPDFGMMTEQLSTADIDTGEIPPRLGSGVVLWRSGNVISYSDFNDNRNEWTLYAAGHTTGSLGIFNGTGADMAKQPMRGKGCAVLQADGAADGDGVFRSMGFNILPAVWSGKLGLEMSFAIDENVIGVTLEIEDDNGNTKHMAGIYIDVVNKKMYYRSGGTSYLLTDFTEFADQPGNALLPPAGVSLRWCNVKIIYDSVTAKFDEFYFNGRSHIEELRGVSAYATASSVVAFERLAYIFGVIQAANDSAKMYVDDVIGTMDEP